MDHSLLFKFERRAVACFVDEENFAVIKKLLSAYSTNCNNTISHYSQNLQVMSASLDSK